MALIELGGRYRAGRDGAVIIYRNGDIEKVDPYKSVRFERHPLKIEGRLIRVRRGHLHFETSALEPPTA